MLGIILMVFNVFLLFWIILSSIVWVLEHEGNLSCHFVPPILLVISLASCLISLVVYNNLLFNILSPC